MTTAHGATEVLDGSGPQDVVLRDVVAAERTSRSSVPSFTRALPSHLALVPAPVVAGATTAQVPDATELNGNVPIGPLPQQTEPFSAQAGPGQQPVPAPQAGPGQQPVPAPQAGPVPLPVPQGGPSQPPVAAEPVDDAPVDDLTHLAEQVPSDDDMTVMRAHPSPADPIAETGPAHSEEPGGVTVLIEDTEARIEHVVRAPLYVGRAPVAPPTPAPIGSPASADGAPLTVIVASPSLIVSSTHLRLRIRGNLLLAQDMWSTNGTWVVPQTGSPYRLGPGEEIPLTPGARIDLGDGVSVTVPAPVQAGPFPGSTYGS